MELNSIERFYKKQAKIYDFTRKFFLFNRQTAVESLELKPESRVIDFACGTGRNIHYLLDHILAKNIKSDRLQKVF